jgi:hypothetical protein
VTKSVTQRRSSPLCASLSQLGPPPPSCHMMQSAEPPAPSNHPSTVTCPYNLRSLDKKYRDSAAKENVCLVPDLSFDSDITAFDRDPTEKAISWLWVPVQIFVGKKLTLWPYLAGSSKSRSYPSPMQLVQNARQTSL